VRRYVSGGGAVIADARFAGMDEKDTGYFVHPGAGLDEVFGVRERGFVSGQESVAFGMEKSYQRILRSRSSSGTMFRETLEPFNGSRVIGRYRDDGGPAVVMNGYERGKTIYVGTLLGAHYYKSGARSARDVVLGMITGLLGHRPPVALSGTRGATVECVVHVHEGARVIYVINHRARSVACTLSVPAVDERTRYLDIVRDEVVVPRIAGERLLFSVRLGGKEVMVIRETFVQPRLRSEAAARSR
jgi:beta-galactosidase